MSLRLRNTWKHAGDRSWKWQAFLDDDGTGELGRVDHVEYVLHPSFRNPVVEVKDPAEGFRLRASGWGTFTLRAVVYLQNGAPKELQHHLELHELPPSGVSA